MTSCDEQKKLIRRRVLALRDSISKEVIIRNSRSIEANVFKLDEFKSAGTVMFFATFRSEPDTIPMIEQSLKSGKRVVLPKVAKTQRAKLVPIEIKDIKADLTAGAYGIPEPGSGKKLSPADIDLVFVPGVAFDAQGRRIGYGGGYYDNFLKEVVLEKRIGIAFGLQVLEEIPCRDSDLRVNKIITEKGVLICSR